MVTSYQNNQSIWLTTYEQIQRIIQNKRIVHQPKTVLQYMQLASINKSGHLSTECGVFNYYSFTLEKKYQ
jgi:hypothetical protein